MNQFSAIDAAVSPSSAAPVRRLRLAYFVSHPIQYQAPLLRRIAQESDIDLHVFFSNDHSVREYKDLGFGVPVQWDVPLLEGYSSEFLPRLADTDRITFAEPLNWGILSRLYHGGFDAVWVFGYSTLASLNAIFAARLLRKPVFIRTDSSLFDRVRSKRTLFAKSLFFRFLKIFLHGALAIGKANEAYWKHHLGADFPVFSMPYAVDNDYFGRKAREAAPRREHLRQELDLPLGCPIILFASKITRGKCCDDLIEAFIRLSPAPGTDPAACLLIVGDGPERPHLEARVRSSGLSNIRFLGFRNQSELPAFYDLCDVFVLPSSHDAWALAVNEVMNAGRPVIVTDRVGCYPDLVRDGVTGFVYPARNIEALTGYLRRLIDDPALRTQMGENSLRLIQQYSFDQDVAGLRQALAHAIPSFTLTGRPSC